MTPRIENQIYSKPFRGAIKDKVSIEETITIIINNQSGRLESIIIDSPSQSLEVR